MNRKQGRDVAENFSATFADDAAEQISATARDVRRHVARAERITPEVQEIIADHDCADSGVELDALARVGFTRPRWLRPEPWYVGRRRVCKVSRDRYSTHTRCELLRERGAQAPPPSNSRSICTHLTIGVTGSMSRARAP